MNKIYSLLDEKFVNELFREKVLPLYPTFTAIEEITIEAIKDNIWQTAYHVVIEYQVLFRDNEGKETKLLLYASAHDSEPRENVYTALKYLWSQSFSHGDLTIPHPLFYLKEYNAVFYRGVEGKNLFHYIQHKNKDEVEKLVVKTADWLSKLHSLKAGEKENFNVINSRVETIVPGREATLKMMKERYPDQADRLAKCYGAIIASEEEYFSSTADRCLIHGDAHTENVIKVSDGKIAFIDFTDICLGDYARDLGTFIQQFEYKGRKMEDPEFIERMKDLFLNSYLSQRGLILTPELEKRINTYYYWTNIRSAIFLFLFHKPQPERAKELMEKTIADLKIC